MPNNKKKEEIKPEKPKKAESQIGQKLKKMEIAFDQEEYLVIDNGTGFVKAGFSGQDLPRIVIPTVLGEHIEQLDSAMVNQSATDAENEKRSYAFGDAAFKARGTHSLYYPVQRGVIEDMDHMLQIWQYIFDELNLEAKNVNVLLTDSPFNTKERRAKMAEIMFEKLRVKSLAIMNSASLSMYSTGKVSGIVAEVGEGISYTVPVFEGYALPHAQIKLEVAGQDITTHLMKSLTDRGIAVADYAHNIRGLKEQMCAISQHYTFDMQSSDDPLNEEERSYELPTGQIIQMNHHERYKATEILFQPKNIGVDGKGIAEMTFNSIEKCDGDLQINLYNNIVLAGGSTLLNGFQARFEDEIIKHAEKSKCKTDINVYGDMHRKNAAWIGGSMISSFSTFRDMVITGDEYRENVENERSSCVHKKSIN